MSAPSSPDPFAAPQPGQEAGASRAPGPVPPAGDGPPAYPSVPSHSSAPSGMPSYPTSSAPVGASAAPGAWSATGTQANSLAVWSLVLAILGWVCFGLLTSIPAIVVGKRAKRAAAEGRANNQGMATAGIVLGWIGTVLNGLLLVAFGLLVATRGWDGFVELLDQYGAVSTP